MEKQVHFEGWFGFPMSNKSKPQNRNPNYVDSNHRKIVTEALHDYPVSPATYEPEGTQDSCNYKQEVCTLWNFCIAVKKPRIPHKKENHRHEHRQRSYEEKRQED